MYYKMTQNRNLKFRNMGESRKSVPQFGKKRFLTFFQLISWVVFGKHLCSKKSPKHVPELSISREFFNIKYWRTLFECPRTFCEDCTSMVALVELLVACAWKTSESWSRKSCDHDKSWGKTWGVINSSSSWLSCFTAWYSCSYAWIFIQDFVFFAQAHVTCLKLTIFFLVFSSFTFEMTQLLV
jgi:hypothetical protein